VHTTPPPMLTGAGRSMPPYPANALRLDEKL
jgi:hypothetical protein